MCAHVVIVDTEMCACSACVRHRSHVFQRHPAKTKPAYKERVNPLGVALRCLKLWLAVPADSPPGKTASVNSFRYFPAPQGLAKLGVADAEVTRGDTGASRADANPAASTVVEPRIEMSTKVHIEKGRNGHGHQVSADAWAA